jgi:ABC-type branched-subunit amino acid transport system ATPase component
VAKAAQAGSHERVLLAIEGITKRFGGLVAVDNVSLSLAAGDLVSIIGRTAPQDHLVQPGDGRSGAHVGAVLFRNEDISRRSRRTAPGSALAAPSRFPRP